MYLLSLKMGALNYIEVATFFWESFIHFVAESCPLHCFRVGMLRNLFTLVFLEEAKTHVLP